VNGLGITMLGKNQPPLLQPIVFLRNLFFEPKWLSPIGKCRKRAIILRKM
jgi:hypothetical protein